LEARSDIEIAIITSLLDGPRTVAELAAEILGSEPESYHSRYMRINRAVKVLESKGYVSTRLLGKPKPYRLTRYAQERLAALTSGETRGQGIVGGFDVVVYGATVLSASVSAFAPRLGHPWAPLLFVYLSGMSTYRIIQTLRRVA